MNRKSYIIRFLVEHSSYDEKRIRKALNQFWKRNPSQGVDGNCGYIVNGYWEHRNPQDVATSLWKDVLKGGIDYSPPFTEQYWIIMTDPKEIKRLKFKYLKR